MRALFSISDAEDSENLPKVTSTQEVPINVEVTKNNKTQGSESKDKISVKEERQKL